MWSDLYFDISIDEGDVGQELISNMYDVDDDCGTYFAGLNPATYEGGD